MRRKVFLLSAGAAVVALLVLALGSQTPAAQADDSSMSWDVVMYEEGELPPHCTNNFDVDGNIETGECPDVESNLWIETDNNGVSNEEYFDLANTVWEVDGYRTNGAESGTDCDNDTDDDGDGKVNDGCPAVGTPESGAECDNAIDENSLDTPDVGHEDDDGDAVHDEPIEDGDGGAVNDGCPIADPLDLDGDTNPDPGYVIPVNGLRATPGTLLNLGATVGNISFMISGNVVAASVVFANNIDDVATNGDVTVRGQMATCDQNTKQFNSAFDIWDATLDMTKLVDTHDMNANGKAQTVDDYWTAGEACAPWPATGTSNGMPDGIDCTPDALITTINASGFLPFYQGRAFGWATLQITPSISTLADVNFMVFNLLTVPEVQGYLSLTVVQYPDAPGADPMVGAVTGQTVTTCPEYYSSPVHLYGVTMDSDFNGDTTVDPAGTGLGGQISRQIMGTGGPFDYYINKSTSEDYDGDTIANVYDRCDMDPDSGTAAQDIDGDTLTGTCETTGDFFNGEDPAGTCAGIAQTLGCPGNPQDALPAGWNTAPPWDSGQDVDGDTQVNFADNCPNVANYTGDPAPGMDTDNDNVGDACDPAPFIPGDGSGYAAPAPGTYLDHDNRCIDQFSIGAPEPRGEDGAVPGKYCYVNEATFATTQPYVNPLMLSLNIAYDDSNDDGDPDWANTNPTAGYQIGEPIDTDSNTDNPAAAPTTDYESDACEAVNGTDPLDPSSKGATGSSLGFMDCDQDRVSDADEETAGSNPFAAMSIPDEITKVIKSLEVKGKWYTVNAAPAGSELDPLPAGVPALPHNAPPAAIQLDVSTPTVVLTDDLDWSSAHIWIDKTATMTVTAGNCTVNGGASATTGKLNEEEAAGWSLEPSKLSWTINMADDAGCTIQYTVLKEIKSPPNPADLTFDPQTVNLTINVTETTACVFAGDVDCDACYDTAEPGLTPPANPADAWDFYDVPVPTLGSGGHISGDPSGTDSRDHAISIINDVLAVLEYAGTSDGGPANAAGRQYNQDVNSDTVNDGIAYDRSVPAARSGAPDGAVSIIVDVLLVLAQAGQFCSP